MFGRKNDISLLIDLGEINLGRHSREPKISELNFEAGHNSYLAILLAAIPLHDIWLLLRRKRGERKDGEENEEEEVNSSCQEDFFLSVSQRITWSG